MKKKLLITGGCGYIGSHTMLAILEAGSYEVISADSYLNSSPRTLQRIQEITGLAVQNYEVDLADPAATERLFEAHPDLAGIIHFAALKSVPESVEQPLLYYRNNLNSLMNLLDCCRKFGVEYFIFSSSCSVYGNPDILPVGEKSPFQSPESPYAATKQMGEQILQDFVRQDASTRCIALRYFNPVGAHPSGKNGEDPRNPPTSLVPIIVETAAGEREKLSVWGDDYPTRDGSCIRDYVHVMDIAEAHLKAVDFLVENPEVRHEVFNLGTGEGVSVFEAVRAFEESTGVKLNYEVAARRPGDVIAVYSDTEKSRTQLGWEARYGIREMMQSAWKWKQYLKGES